MPSNTTVPKVPKGWRRLKPEEFVGREDMVRRAGEWQSADGMTAGHYGMVFIRRIKPKAKRDVPEADFGDIRAAYLAWLAKTNTNRCLRDAFEAGAQWGKGQKP